MASDNTEARRERVRSLWLKSDRAIAEILIEEGFAGDSKRTPEGRASQLACTVTTVWRDRKALRKQWREVKRIVAEDVHESRGEHLAVLESLQDMGVEMLADSKLKGTPRAQALQAVTRIVEAKGKALGVAEIEPIDAESEKGAPTPQVVGLLISGRNLSPEMKKDLSEQGYAFDADDEKKGKHKRRRRRKTSASAS